MEWGVFSHSGKQISNWATEHHSTLRDRPVRAQTAFDAIRAQLPQSLPETAVALEDIMADFERIVPKLLYSRGL